MPMDAFVVVKTLRAAIYGKVALVRHRVSGVVYAMKVMSLAHMGAQRAIAGPIVCEDGNAELRVLRRLSGNRVTAGGAESLRGQDAGVDRTSASAHPTWDALAGRPNALAPIDHHHILTLHTDFVDTRANARCLVFDYCPYGELYDQLQKAPDQTLALATSRAFFAQIACAVRFIHAMNIAHRDLSLENVLVDANRQCRLGDFGLACEYGTMCSGRVGKAFYMAPEVYDWQPDEFYNGLQADMWSLGIILFVLATGAPPFEAAHEVDARFRVVKAKGIRELLAVWKLDEKLPFEVCELLEVLLRVDPDDRVNIEGVCSHPWLQSAFDTQGFAWGNLTLSSRSDHPDGRAAMHDSIEKSSDDEYNEQSEPQEEVETDVGTSLIGGGNTKRHRKRIKISIGESLVVPSAPSTGRVAGFFGGPLTGDEGVMRIGPPPTLRHERFHSESSPDGSSRRAVQPNTSPIMWPKIDVKTSLRSLFQPGRGMNHGATDDQENAEDPETKESRGGNMIPDASPNRRRPRLDSSSSCSSTSSSPNPSQQSTAIVTDDSEDTSVKLSTDQAGAHMCRFCLQWVLAQKCTHRVTLPMRDDSSTEDSERRSKTRRVCDACFLVVSAALVGNRESDAAADEAQWLYGSKRHAPQAA